MAKSHKDEPLVLKLENDSCPGVSIMSNPGMQQSTV